MANTKEQIEKAKAEVKAFEEAKKAEEAEKVSEPTMVEQLKVQRKISKNQAKKDSK